MKISVRLTLWYSGMLLVSLLLMGAVLYHELVYEVRDSVPPGQREQAPKQISDILFLYGAPTLALLLVGGWFLMRRTLGPVTALTDTVERIHAETLHERVPHAGKGDEFDRLTAVFNDMMNRLQDSFGRIREFTVHASHELKTPLTVMRGEVETLLRSGDCTAMQREALAGHLSEIQRLTQIVDNLALLARADAGLVTLAHDDVRLDELVREAYEDARILGESQRLKVELDACDETIIQGDRHRLRQVLLNLADNAAKYNQSDGVVRISLRKDAEHAVVTVANSGPGIPPEQLPRVFDRFFRTEAAHKSRLDGCGLGLSIVQWIVTGHGGRIELSSQPNGLTIVTVKLPLRTLLPEPKQLSVAGTPITN